MNAVGESSIFNDFFCGFCKSGGKVGVDVMAGVFNTVEVKEDVLIDGGFGLGGDDEECTDNGDVVVIEWIFDVCLIISKLIVSEFIPSEFIPEFTPEYIPSEADNEIRGFSNSNGLDPSDSNVLELTSPSLKLVVYTDSSLDIPPSSLNIDE